MLFIKSILFFSFPSKIASQMDDRIRSNLPLLKKLERARLRDLCDSIEEERQPSFDKPLQRAKQKQGLLVFHSLSF